MIVFARKLGHNNAVMVRDKACFCFFWAKILLPNIYTGHGAGL